MVGLWCIITNKCAASSSSEDKDNFLLVFVLEEEEIVGLFLLPYICNLVSDNGILAKQDLDAFFFINRSKVSLCCNGGEAG